MANYNNLKAGIDAVIKTNGRQEISGAALNTQLKNMIAELGAGYQYMGVATPATNPGTPDANVFYLASEAGTYTNFGGIVINEGEVCVLVWNGTWTKQVTGIATAESVSQLGQKVAEISQSFTIDSLTPKSITDYSYVKTDGAIGTVSYYDVKAYEFEVMPNGRYLVSGRVGSFESVCLCAFYDENGIFIPGSSLYPEQGVTYIRKEIFAPSNAKTIKVSGNTNNQAGQVEVYEINIGSIGAKALFDSVDTYRSIIGDGSHFDKMSIITGNKLSAGEWTLRYSDSYNYIEKQPDGSFKIVVNSNSGINPGIWIRGIDFTPYLNKPCRVRFSLKNSQLIKFDTGSTNIHELVSSADFRDVEIYDVIGYALNRWQIFFSFPGSGSCEFYIKDFYCEVIDDNYTNTLSVLSQLASNGFSGKRVSILADSYSGWGTPDQNNADGLWTYPGNRCRYPQENLNVPVVSMMWWYKVITALNMELGINESWAGSRISWDGETESTDIGANKHMASATRISHLDNNGIPDIILIQGGSNDIAGNVPIGNINTENPADYTDEQIAALPVNTFSDAVRTMIIRCMKSYPNARIAFVSPIYNKANSLTISSIAPYLERMKEICDLLGCIFVDMRKMGMTPYVDDIFGGDNIHPNATGMEKISQRVINALKTI